MEIDIVVDELQKIKVLYPNLSNEEILKILEIKTLMEIRGGVTK